MARPQILPNVDVLTRYRDQGMTQQQIADRVNDDNRRTMGPDYRAITRAAVSVALHRADESGGQRPRYEEEIPWSPIAKQYYNDYLRTQLRTWARINRGEQDQLTDRALREFASFKKNLEARDAVIHYDDERGFYRVKRRPGIDTGLIRLTDEQVHQRGLTERLNEFLANKRRAR